ncbi:MAG: LIC_13387 family protein [Massilia sp.]
MITLPALLIAASAAIILLLGLVHLLFTFSGPKLMPRDRELQARMREVSPVITRETTMWRAWVGFNASHSFGAIMFGAVYGYLSLVHSAFLLRSAFLLWLGLLLLGGYLFLGKRYWFSIPFRGILLALTLYVLALLSTWV